MRAVVQRVRDCRVTTGNKISGQIADGLLIYLGVCRDDDKSDAEYLAVKMANLRIFIDDTGKMNLSAIDLKKELLVVSQFTLCADVRKGRRPSYAHAAEPGQAEDLYRYFIECLQNLSFTPKEGVFGGKMEVSYTNDGPITILLDSKKKI
jgi:D-tyrosyl-tRNA(Tyr) deacylase